MTVANNYRCAYALFALIVIAYLIMAIQFPMAYLWATYEDLAGEWLQFWLFVIALFYFFRLAIRKSRFRLFFSFLTLCCFYVAMEEISWGQRLLDLPTPDFFLKHNIQKETNLHNLFTGPLATTTKQLIEYGLAAGLIGYGLIFPLTLKWKVPAARMLIRVGIAPPPLWLWPFFVLSGILELGLLRFNEAEVAEILIAFALAMIGMYYFAAYGVDHGFEKIIRIGGDYPVSLARGMAVVLVVAALLAAGTTGHSYISPNNHARIQNRLLNGVEKFAGRYKRFEQWETAAMLYLRVHQAEPQRNSILRKLAECYLQMGDEQQFKHYNTVALQNDLARLKDKPDSIAVNQSLTRTYRQTGDITEAEYHLQQALKIAQERVALKPESANAAYWLGRTYQLMGRNQMALDHYENACRLSPAKHKYQKAYYRLKKDSHLEEN